MNLTERNRRLLHITLLATLLGGPLCLSVRASDTPIVIADGSLTVDATVPWNTFKSVDGKTRSHPHNTKTVAQVTVKVGGGAPQTFKFSKQKCTVIVQYDTTEIRVDTNDAGKALQVITDFDSFRVGAKANVMAHIKQDSNTHISSVTVLQAGQQVFSATPSGGTTVSISYK